MYELIIKELKKSEKIVFFTGAGMSTESGIPDFRSGSGLYSENDFNGYVPEQILGLDFFLKNPEIFYKFYFNKIIYKDAMPNEGHYTIAEIEKLGYDVTVITQNIDGLHSMAGSSNVIELHGSALKNYCVGCKKRFNLEQILEFENSIPICDSCGGLVRPDVTLYGEPLEVDTLASAVSRISDADVLFAIGSSLTVQPAAGLLDYFNGRMFVIINRDPTYYDQKADFVINRGCGDVLSELAGGLNE